MPLIKPTFLKIRAHNIISILFLMFSVHNVDVQDQLKYLKSAIESSLKLGELEKSKI